MRGGETMTKVELTNLLEKAFKNFIQKHPNCEFKYPKSGRIEKIQIAQQSDKLTDIDVNRFIENLVEQSINLPDPLQNDIQAGISIEDFLKLFN